MKQFCQMYLKTKQRKLELFTVPVHSCGIHFVLFLRRTQGRPRHSEKTQGTRKKKYHLKKNDTTTCGFSRARRDAWACAAPTAARRRRRCGGATPKANPCATPAASTTNCTASIGRWPCARTASRSVFVFIQFAARHEVEAPHNPQILFCFCEFFSASSFLHLLTKQRCHVRFLHRIEKSKSLQW